MNLSRRGLLRSALGAAAAALVPTRKVLRADEPARYLVQHGPPYDGGFLVPQELEGTLLSTSPMSRTVTFTAKRLVSSVHVSPELLKDSAVCSQHMRRVVEECRHAGTD